MKNTLSYLLSFFYTRNKDTQFQGRNTLQKRPIQVRKPISKIDGGVYVTRVYESKRITVNKGTNTREQQIQIENTSGN